MFLSLYFKKRISGKQFFKNVTVTSASVAGGTAGWVGGATVGATYGSIVPIYGTAIGGFVGGIAGAYAGSTGLGVGTKKIVNYFYEDDANLMVSVFEKKMVQLVEDYMLSKEEYEEVLLELQKKMDGATLKDMFACANREEFAEKMLVEIIEPVVKKRKLVVLPNEKKILDTVKDIIARGKKPKL